MTPIAMLGPINDPKPRRDAPGFRRWFADEEMDLIVWYSPGGEIEGFQLCYDKPHHVHAFTWTNKGGLAHAKVDLGDDSPLKNQSPVLVADGTVPLERVTARFAAESAELDFELSRLVLEKLQAPK